jgi:hypothetical protein
VFSKFSRCLPFSKWLPKYGIKMGGKNSILSDIIKIPTPFEPPKIWL